MIPASFPPILILAGGLGTRLGDISSSKPKAMMEIAGEPFISYQLKLLKEQGTEEVVLCLSHLSDQISNFIGDGSRFGLKVMYSYDGDTRLGTGGALRRAAALLDGKVREKTGKNDRHHHPSNKTKGHTDDQTAEHSVAERCANHCADHRAEHCADHCAEHCADHCAEHFGVLYGDTFLDIQYPPVYQAFLSSGKQGLMTVLKNNNQWDKSNILFANGQVIKYDKIETTGMQHIDYGLSILSRHVFDQITDATFDLSVVFQALIKAGQMAGYEVSQRFYAIDTPEKLAETSEYLIQRRERLLI